MIYKDEYIRSLLNIGIEAGYIMAHMGISREQIDKIKEEK